MLPFYAILRAVPDRLGDAISMFSAIFILFLLPTEYIEGALGVTLFRQFFALFIIDYLLLGYLGAMPAEGSVVLARVGTVYYSRISYHLAGSGIVEKPKKCLSISASVLGGSLQTADKFRGGYQTDWTYTNPAGSVFAAGRSFHHHQPMRRRNASFPTGL